MKRYLIDNPEKKVAYKRKYYDTHRDELLVKARSKYVANREKNLERRKAYYLANKPAHAAKMREWQKANPDAVNAHAHKRRARKIGAPGHFTPKEWSARVKEFASACAYCGRHASRLEQEHVVPLMSGGTNYIDNVVPACRSCNARKGTDSLLLFLVKNARLLVA
jgi:5-methylcytosine-specific restriction endonuclease McrA